MAEPRVTETGVPIEHLDYSYVRNCKNVKEVEKILRVLRYDYTTNTCSILNTFVQYSTCTYMYKHCCQVSVDFFMKFARSKSEGYYPDLIRFTEDRLYQICPQR